jgi:hypothetical protein
MATFIMPFGHCEEPFCGDEAIPNVGRPTTRLLRRHKTAPRNDRGASPEFVRRGSSLTTDRGVFLSLPVRGEGGGGGVCGDFLPPP